MVARLLVTLLAATALVPGAASAVTLGPARGSSGFCAPSVAGDGTAYLTGSDGRGWVEVAPFDTAPGPAENLLKTEASAGATGRHVVAGAAADGELLMAYTRVSSRPRVHRRVRAIVRAPTGATSVPLTISQSGRTADTPALAVGRGGEAIAAFVRHDADGQWHVQYAIRPRSGAPFGQPRTVPGEDGVIQRGGRIDVAVAPGGGGVLTWLTRPRSSGAPRRLMALVVDERGAGSPDVLEPRAASDPQETPQDRTAAAYGSDGRGMVAWLRRSGGSGVTLVAAALSAQGVGRAEAVGNYDGHLDRWGEDLRGWAVVADGHGTATVAWAPLGPLAGGATGVVRARSRDAGGTWSAPVALSDARAESSLIDLAGDDAGDLVAVWRVGETGHARTMVASRAAGGGWDTARAASGEEIDPYRVAAAMSQSGRFVVTWHVGGGPGCTRAFGSFP